MNINRLILFPAIMLCCILYILGVSSILMKQVEPAINTSNLTSQQVSPVAPAVKPLPLLRIVLIHSYDMDDVCTSPQRRGILEQVRKLTNKYDISIREYFLNTKIRNNHKDLEFLANQVLSLVKKENPDYIFTTDDAAFEFCAIPLINDNIRVFSTGLNRPIESYSQGFSIKTQNLIAVQETISIDQIFSFFERFRFTPNKWYVLYDDTPTSYYMVKNYENILKGKGATEYKKLDTIPDLRYFLRELNGKPQGVIVLAIQRLYDFDANNNMGGFIDKSIMFREFQLFNTRHIELCANTIYPDYGYALAGGPDFYKMGQHIGNCFLDVVRTGVFMGNVFDAVSYTSLNNLRLEQLGFISMAKDGPSVIKNVYHGRQKK